MTISVPRRSRYSKLCNRKYQYCLFCTIVVLCVIMMFTTTNSEVEEAPPVIYINHDVSFVSNDPKCPLKGNKWIVVTTVDYPTPAIQQFLTLKTPWNLIVIADRKTPRDWPNRVSDPSKRLRFVSFEEQNNLTFQILQFLPQESHARKNIGYLLAIQCGAKVIFEADDDNLLLKNDIQLLPKVVRPQHVPWIAFHRQRSPFINIYGSFGHPQIWPRGFPVDEIRNITEDGWHSARRNLDKGTHAYIQHYLADPDVDAMYRLAHPISIGQIEFDRDQPPIALQPYTFSPYSAQNTVTYYEAFWGLYLPVTTTSRVSDIWRSYWVQRLLWDIDGRLVFGTTNVKRTGKSHSYMEEQIAEKQLYNQSSSFVRFLASWSCSHYTFVEEILQLSQDTAHAGFWNSNETNIMEAWLADLVSIGYIFPAIARLSSSPSSIKRKPVAVCVTGLIECISEAWSVTHSAIRKKISPEVDSFLLLSSSSSRRGPIPLDTRLKQALSYTDSTMTILYEDRAIDPQIPSTCQTYYQPEINMALEMNYFQQLWALSECFDLIKEYEKAMGVRYEFIIRSRVDANLDYIKKTLSFPKNTTILIPDENHFFGYNDRFAIGPAALMEKYMRRWHDIKNCHVKNLHPESFLKSSLDRLGIVVQPVSNLTFTQQLHGKDQCH